MKNAIFVFLCFVFIQGASLVCAQHTDIRPRVEAGKIQVDGYDDEEGAVEPDLRVFGYDFGEDPAEPHFAADPGFNASAQSGLPSGSQLSLHVLGGARFGLPGNLMYWDGADHDSAQPGVQPSFTLPNEQTSLRVTLGSRNVLIDGQLGDLSGLSFATVGATGTVHTHVSSFLQSQSGDPADGIYFFAMRLQSSASAIADSDPLFIVFNHGLDEELHDVAIEWVQTSLVPEPAYLGSCLIGLAAAASLRNRKSPGV